VKINLNGVILKDDARFYHTEDFLRRKGHVFYELGTPPEDLDFIIFPFKKAIDESIYNDEYFSSLGKKTIVFSGLRNAYLANKCVEHGLKYYPMMEDQSIALKNAVPTSEGIIAYLIENRERTVANSSILIIGYGVCGKDLSKRLKALGANVYALVRNREKECAAFVDSITPIYPVELEGLRFDVYINTVPGRVLTDETLKRANGALFVDIASKPGFDMDLAKRLNEKSALLPGIPGKYAVWTAGEILGEYIHYILGGRDRA